MPKSYTKLIQAAIRAKKRAYAPYSNFRVGAALLSKDGTIITGCNVENSSYSLTLCAERTAIFKAYSAGKRAFAAIAVVSDNEDYTPPCGACRQVLLELAGDIDFVMINAKKKVKVIRIKSLLPLAFTQDNLKRIKRTKKA